MLNEEKDFSEALGRFLQAALRECAEPADYNNEAVEIIDARNHLFRLAGRRGTDEEQNIYAIRDLCRIDDLTLDTVPDPGRLRALARTFGLEGK